MRLGYGRWSNCYFHKRINVTEFKMQFINAAKEEEEKEQSFTPRSRVKIESDTKTRDFNQTYKVVGFRP